MDATATAESRSNDQRALAGRGARVWVVTEIYWPEETSTGYFLTRLAEELVVRRPTAVLCGQPKYDLRGERIPSREVHHGVAVIRCFGTALDKDVLTFRVLNMLTIAVAVFVSGVRRFHRGDVVLVATNPPVLPYMTALAARFRGARAAVMMQDVYPESLVAAGLARPGSLTVRLIAMFNRLLYHLVDRVVVLGRDMDQLVKSKLGARSTTRSVVIRNWADLSDVTPSERRLNPLLLELGLALKFVVQFAGNIGRVQDVETIARAARSLLSTDPDVHFLFIGSGAQRLWLERFIAQERLTNVTLLPPRARSEQQVFLNACDVTVSAFVPGMCGVGVPSRMYNIMASGKPMIAAVDEQSEQALVIREEAIGWVVPVGDDLSIANAVRAAKADAGLVAAMGARARQAAEAKYSMQAAIYAYERLVDTMAGEGA